MYMLIAVFNQCHLKDVIEDLFESHIEGVTISDVIGKGSLGFNEVDNNPADFFQKVKVEIVVSNEKTLDTAMECIRANCHDLGRGAGKMWWVDVGGVERIRTGEKDVDALTTTIDKKISNIPSIVTTAIDTPCS